MAYTGFNKLLQQGMSPGLAAYIGRKKYGKQQFQAAAAGHHSLRGAMTAAQKKN